MQTATLGSVPCLPCDIGTVLSQQPIACQARRVGCRPRFQAEFRDWKTAAPFAVRRSVWLSRQSKQVLAVLTLRKPDDILPLAKRRRRRQSGIVPALSDRRFNCLPPATGL